MVYCLKTALHLYTLVTFIYLELVIMEIRQTAPLFTAWINGSNIFDKSRSRCNTLETAQILSHTLFNKPYRELYTYERSYIIQQIAKATQPFKNNIFNGGF